MLRGVLQFLDRQLHQGKVRQPLSIERGRNFASQRSHGLYRRSRAGRLSESSNRRRRLIKLAAASRPFGVEAFALDAFPDHARARLSDQTSFKNDAPDASADGAGDLVHFSVSGRTFVGAKARLGWLSLLSDWRPIGRLHAADGFELVDLVRLLVDGALILDRPIAGLLEGLAAPFCNLPEPESALDALSRRILRRAAALPGNSGTLATYLYTANRRPISDRAWRFHAISADKLRGSIGHTTWPRADRWDFQPPAVTENPWFFWRTRFPEAGDQGVKLYLAPEPGRALDMACFLFETVSDSGANAFKIFGDNLAILRPDKIIVYFKKIEQLNAFALDICRTMGAIEAQAVPFTCDMRDGLISWGRDPDAPAHGGATGPRTSWRLHICQLLSQGMEIARAQGFGAEMVVGTALARVALSGVNPTNWSITQ